MTNVTQWHEAGQSELDALEVEIREAFKGVRLDGGTSWAQAELIDLSNYTDDEYVAAGQASEGKPWEDLVEDAEWLDRWSGFSFLDALGFRFHIAPLMIRFLRSTGGDFLFHAIDRPLCLEDFHRIMTGRQLAAIARLVRFMADHEECDDGPWRDAYDRIWKAWDDQPGAEVTPR